MLLQVWILGYYYHLFTSRKLAKALQENVIFMWISGKQTPDFRTLNNFRILLGEEIETVFKRTVQCRVTLGLIDGTQGFIDGTIIQADANKHKAIWKKNVKKRLTEIREEIDELAKQISNHVKEEQAKEDEQFKDEDFNDGLKSEASIENILDIAEEIERELKGKRKDEEEKALYEASKRIQELAEKEKLYEEKEETLGNRNSYSKTDTDATMFRDKEGVLRPGYT